MQGGQELGKELLAPRQHERRLALESFACCATNGLQLLGFSHRRNRLDEPLLEFLQAAERTRAAEVEQLIIVVQLVITHRCAS